MSRIFLTSDLHFGHQNIIKFNPDTRASDDPRLSEMKALCLAVEEEKDHNKRHDIRKQLKSLLKEMTADMDQRMIERWRAQVSDRDTVYIHGDVFFDEPRRAVEILKQLPGKKHLIFGNHDQVIRNNKSVQEHFASAQDMLETRIGKQSVVMLHYPMMSWNKSHHGAMHTFGHVHGKLDNDPEVKGRRMMDVGIDSRPLGVAPSDGELTLWDWEQVYDLLKDRPVTVHH